MPHPGPLKQGWPVVRWLKRQRFIGAIERFWQKSYAPDYVGLLVLLLLYIEVVVFIQPFHRMFSLDDRSKAYPHALVETVPVLWMFLLGGGLPLLVICLWTLAARHSFHQAHVTVLGLLTSLVLSMFLTDIVKNSVGRPRPDLIARCKPKDDTPLHELVTIDVCTAIENNSLHDGWRSFPSGHSSFAFSGLGFLALFLAGQMHVFRPKTDLTRVLVALAPLIGAAWIAISRLEDYRHDAYDVTSGSLLGMMTAYSCYRRYFRRLNSTKCHEPHPSRLESFAAVEQIETKVDIEGGLYSGRSSVSYSGDVTESLPLTESRARP